ncbi:MAG: zinc ribbon domain-containing protein [Nitrospiraceae bacterium]|nr:MAG: zinc ribbon domain-containing protein [Nitrospiraceae bacterium]
MPIYEYYCPNCLKVHELWQSIYDTDARACPECSELMQKLISKTSFQLKGGGWYEDGYCTKKDATDFEKNPAEAATCGKDGNTDKPACAGCSA